MKNGTYEATLKGTHTDTTITVYNGTYKLGNGRYITEKTMIDYYNIGIQIPVEPSKYDIEWIVNGKTKQVIPLNGNYAMCQWKIKQIKPNYRMGVLIPVKSKSL